MINYSGIGFNRCYRTAAIVGAAIGGAGLLYGVGKDISNTHKANEIQKSLKTPTDVIPAEFYQNREIARQMAQIGLPQQQYNNNLNNINQTQAASLAAASRSANPGSSIASIARQGDNAKNTLDAEDATARANNQRYFLQENGKLGAREDQQEQTNVFDPYTRDFNQMQAYRGAANTQTGQLINSAGTLGNSIMKYKDQFPSLFGGGDTIPGSTDIGMMGGGA